MLHLASSMEEDEELAVAANAPFTGLIICVTGLSKEARRKVMEVTQRMGGQYSPNLHPRCTHLLVGNFDGQKFAHALKYGSENGLFLVTVGWLVESVKWNARLKESLFSVKILKDIAKQLFDATQEPHDPSLERCSYKSLSGKTFYIDPEIPAEMKKKVSDMCRREGANFLDRWHVGCVASHVVCEGSSAQKYIGHVTHLVTPHWVLKTTGEQRVQQLLHLSADLARHVSLVLDDLQNRIEREEINAEDSVFDSPRQRGRVNLHERRQIVKSAKKGIRNRRGRLSIFQPSIRPITPNKLLDSVCWSVSEPPSMASLYSDSSPSEDASEEDAREDHQSPTISMKDKDPEASFANITRPFKECEKSSLLLKSHFLTILFPIDRFSEMGPSSRTFFSQHGFSCAQLLDYVYAFYQENMASSEIQVAIHTDSRTADRLRSAYCSEEMVAPARVIFKRIDFLGSRTCFEMLKRVGSGIHSSVYELLLRA